MESLSLANSSIFSTYIWMKELGVVLQRNCWLLKWIIIWKLNIEFKRYGMKGSVILNLEQNTSVVIQMSHYCGPLGQTFQSTGGFSSIYFRQFQILFKAKRLLGAEEFPIKSICYIFFCIILFQKRNFLLQMQYIKYFFFICIFKINHIFFIRNKYKKMILGDQQVQQLISDGVHKQDYRNKKKLFTKCPECKQEFDKTQNKPYLLECGHVCCRNCLKSTENKKCMANQCLKMKKLKQKDYVKLFGKFDQNQKYLYRFTVIIEYQSITVSEKDENTLISSILDQHPTFKYFQSTKKDKCNVVIKTTTKFYDQIKDLPLASFKSILYPSSKDNKSNLITVLPDRSLGGNEQ